MKSPRPPFQEASNVRAFSSPGQDQRLWPWMSAERMIRPVWTDGQPPVTIDARQEQKHLVVEVSDHGTGVPLESVHQMFQPYAHFASSKSQPSSIGLGLHVARRLARLMGGELTYHREGDRTVFALSLPSDSV